MDETGQRVEIGEAARRLGITTDGVRKRLKRGQLRGGKTGDGRWYVIFEAESTPVLDSESDLDNEPDPSSMIVDRLLDKLDERDRQLDERDRRIETLERERFELAGRLGYFQAQVEEARERIRLLEAPRETPKVEKLKGRAWWEKLLGR